MIIKNNLFYTNLYWNTGENLFCFIKTKPFLKCMFVKKCRLLILKVWSCCAVPCQYTKSSGRIIHLFFTLWTNYRILLYLAVEANLWKKNNLYINVFKYYIFIYIFCINFKQVLILASPLTNWFRVKSKFINKKINKIIYFFN